MAYLPRAKPALEPFVRGFPRTESLNKGGKVGCGCGCLQAVLLQENELDEVSDGATL